MTFVVLLISPFYVELPSVTSGAAELVVSFVEIGKNGVVSPRYPSILLSVTSSGGQFVPSVIITVTNPPYCLNSWPYYEWVITERASDYVITAQSFPSESIKDDFIFTFDRIGYNTKTIRREIEGNAPDIIITDENGNVITNSDVEFNMDAIPSHTLVSSQFRTVFVGSRKYYVTAYAYQSEFTWEEGLSYVVIDENFNLVTDEQTCNNAIFTCLVGPYFAQAFSTETLDQLAAWAQEIIEYAGLAHTLAGLRDQFAQLAGFLIAKKLGSPSGKLPEPATTSQKIINNIGEVVDLWEEFLKKTPSYLEIGVVLTKELLFTVATARLHNAGEMFLSLKGDVESYRGTTRFEYPQINGLYAQWVEAASELLNAIDILTDILPDPDLFHQAVDIAVNMIAGACGVPAAALYESFGVAECLANSLSKFVSLRDEFYEWLEPRKEASALLRQKIQNTGQTKIIIPFPGPDDFKISAYYVSTSMTQVTLVAGKSATFTVNVELISGTVPTVKLSVSGHDSTIFTYFTIQSATPPFTSSLIISTSSSSSGMYVLTLTGTSSRLTRDCKIIVNVQNPPPPSQAAITIDPLNSATGTVLYGVYTRYHGTIDPYWNGWEVRLSQSLDGGNLWYIQGNWIPSSNNEWYYPSSMTATPISLSAWLGLEHPVTYLMQAQIIGTIAESNIISFTMAKAPTSVEISIADDIIYTDETVTISGVISSSLGYSGSRYACVGTWYVDWRQQGGIWNPLASGSVHAEFEIPPDGGPYCILFNIPAQTWAPQNPGNYDFRARYSGDNKYEASTSEEKKVIVQPSTYTISISINNLPPNNFTQIYIDDNPIDSLNGGSTGQYEMSTSNSHKVSVDSIISYGTNTRYVSQKSWQTVSTPGTYNIDYNREYRLTVESSPADSGSIALTGSTWFKEGTMVEARADPNEGFVFDYWTVDETYYGDSNYISFTMQSPHVLKALFTDSAVGARAHLAVRGFDDKIYCRIYNSSLEEWADWEAVSAGATCDSPAAAMVGGNLHIVVRGMDGYSLWYGWINLTDNSFHGWTRLSGSTPSAPTLTSNGTALYLVVRGMNNRIYFRSYDCASHAWEEWSAVPTGVTCDSPAAAMVGGSLHVVVRGMDEYSLWHGHLTNPADPGSFIGWTKLSGSTPSAPTLASNGTVLSLVVRGFNDRIYYRIYQGSWSGWNVLPGATCDSPAAALLGNDLHIVVRGLDGNTLWHGYLADPSDPESFSGWSWLSGATPSAPTLTS